MCQDCNCLHGKYGAVGRVVDYRSGGTRIDPILVFLALPLPKSPNSIWLKFMAVVGNAVPGRTPRGVARHGTVRYGTQPPPPPLPRHYFLAVVTRGAYFYGLY